MAIDSYAEHWWKIHPCAFQMKLAYIIGQPEWKMSTPTIVKQHSNNNTTKKNLSLLFDRTKCTKCINNVKNCL